MPSFLFREDAELLIRGGIRMGTVRSLFVISIVAVVTVAIPVMCSGV